MKISIILTFCAALGLASCSKSSLNNNGTGTANPVAASTVPAAVVSSFNASFSGATGVEWFRGSGSFTSQFNLGSQRHEAGFDDNGHQSSHSIICLDGAVPQAVLDAFRARFATDSVYEWKLGSDGNWKAHFMRGSTKYEATFSPSGTLVKFEQA